MTTTIRILKESFHWKNFLLLFFCFLLTEGIFSWLFIRNSLVIEGYTKLLGIGIYAFMLSRYRTLEKDERIYLFLFTAVMLRLVGESVIKYDTLFRQLTLFTVLFPVVYVVFTKYLLRITGMDPLPFFAKFYLLIYTIFMILFGRGFSFNLALTDMTDYGPFSGDTRIIHASHILMMIVPLLWYTHRYVITGMGKYLLPVTFCVVVILLHQHRSVWSSALVAVFFYFIAVIRNGMLQTGRLTKILIIVTGVAAISYFFAANLLPGFVDFLSDRFSEILNPAREGSTGNFRLEQREVYGRLFLQRPIFGWTFEGFEMPNPLVDWWPPLSGQHFHEGYMEMLFYLGIAGLLLKYSFLFYLLLKVFSKNITGHSIILAAFCISGLVFSFNYVLPLIFWAVTGMAMYYIEQDKLNLNSNNPG